MLFNSVWCKTMENKLTSIVLNLILVGIIFSIGLFLYWSLKPYNIIDYKIEKLEMQKKEYVVGEALTYRIVFCKKGNYKGEVIRRLHDGVYYSFPALTSTIKEGCHNFISTSNITPNVPEGEYTFEDEIIYRPNPIKEIRYFIESEPFYIINNN